MARMMTRTWAIVAAASLAGCAPAVTRAPPSFAPDATISFESDSWGSPLMRWTIDAAGNGSLSVADERGEGGKGVERPMKQIAFRAGAEGYAKVRAALVPAERWAGKEIPCKLEITDMPYGSLRWGNVSTRFNQGCRSSEADIFENAVEAALDHIVAFGKATR